MANYILLGIKVGPGPIERCKCENYDLQNKVEDLRQEAAAKSKMSAEAIELLYHGRILDLEMSLKDCGVKPGEMVHVIKKNVEKKSTEPLKITEADTKEFFTHCKSLGFPSAPQSWSDLGVTRANFAFVINFLSEPSSMQKFLALTPELSDDPVAMNFLSAPGLVFQLLMPDNFKSVAEKHPALIQAVIKIFKSMDKDMLQRLNEHSSIFNMEMDSEDDVDVVGDDGDDEGDEESSEGYPSTGGLITQGQLAAALAYAEARTGRESTGQPAGGDLLGSILASDNTATPSTSSQQPRLLITSDMISNALSQAFSSTPSSAAAAASGEPSTIPPFNLESPSSSASSDNGRNYTEQMLRMREMGLTDNRINLRALIVSSGDVNAAINLVFSGAIND